MDITLDAANLVLNDPPKIGWVKVKDVVARLWKHNPKLHNIGELCESIARYGVQELPVYDSNLVAVNGEQGAWKAGNGRIEALAFMANDKHYKNQFPNGPRGCGVDKDGDWVCPAIFGVDAKDLAQAEAYAIDSNNLVMSGGDFTGWDFLHMWGEEYKEVIENLASAGELPVTIPPDFFDDLISDFQPPSLKDLEKEYGDFEESDMFPWIKVQVPPETKRVWDETLARMEGDTDAQKIEVMLLKVADAEA